MVVIRGRSRWLFVPLVAAMLLSAPTPSEAFIKWMYPLTEVLDSRRTSASAG